MKCKRSNDGRQLDRKAMNTLRMQAIKAVRQGRPVADVAEAFGVSERTLYRWLARMANEGQNGLLSKPKSGRPPKLTDTETRWLARVVRDETPQQLRMPYALWTLSRIQELIRRRLDKTLSQGAVRRIMKVLGFTPQKPLYRAYQQDPELVRQWEQETYPEIQAEARRVGATLYFADEAGLRSDYHAGTTWAPAGETPVVQTTGSRFAVNLLSAVSPRGTLRFMVHEGRVNADVFLTFLKRLMKETEGPVFVIVDGHPAHRAKKVQHFEAKTDGQLRLFYLPPYAPQLNPDEGVWANLKREVAKRCVTSPKEMKAVARSVLHRIQKLPQLVQSFFHHPEFRYAIPDNTS